MSKLLKISLCFAVFAMLQAASGEGSAAPIVVLSVDFNADPSPTESGFQSFGTPNSASNPRGFPYGGLSLAYTQTGTVNVDLVADTGETLGGRDRGAIPETIPFTQSDLYQDFVQHDAANRYLDILITGLLPNHPYDLKFWGYDDDVTDQSNKMNFIDYSLDPIPGATGYIQWGLGPVTADNQYSITLSGVSSATGTMKWQAHVFNIGEDPGSGSQDFAKLNGLQISTIPEPSSFLMLGFMGSALAMSFRRRRLVVQSVATVQP